MNLIDRNIYVIVQLTVYCVCDLQIVIFCKSYGVMHYSWELADVSEDRVAFVLKGVVDYLAKYVETSGTTYTVTEHIITQD